MLQRFLYLQWKAFTCGVGFATGLAQKILLGFAWIYFAAIFASLAFVAFWGVQEELGEDPLPIISGYLLYAFAFWIVLRYFLQKMPIVHIQPLLVLPISKKRIVRFGLLKTVFSFYNISNLFFFVPFGIILIQQDYNLLGVIGWWVAIGSIILTTNFLNIMLNSVDRILIQVAVLLLALFALQYFEVFDLTTWTSPLFMAAYHQPLYSLIPLVLLGITYQWSFTHFKDKLMLDGGTIQPKAETHRGADLYWLDRFGRMAIFLRNDIRLIIRNKRARMAVWMGVGFLFYGLIFMSDIYKGSAMTVFVGIFVSGGFLFGFGQYVPSWDSSYYPLMMSQNISYKEYLTSKWWLVVVGTLAGMILSSFYVFFGWEMYFAILAGGIYNLGINAYLVLLSGAYTRVPIDLTANNKAFGDKRSFNLKTILLSIPKIIVPMFVYYVGVLIQSKSLGLILVALVGVLGFAFRNLVFGWIENIYQKEKYKTLQAYKQKNT
ncbi:MAG: DUF5687 family protein [Bacteroidetes bacterium]|nr:DUF5687 family protein [Bacteroidota bacterium]MDA0889293.1 DUF5687 family protein [Bacteroidota bacterium]MDA1085166.1 DUF5687 family protein [Bacteroidota bacterium]